MRRPHLPGRQGRPAGGGPADETPVGRRYRFLLRTASAEALETGHTDALRRLPGETRASILGTVQEQLVVGQRLTPDDVVPIAHLVTLGERRTPGVLLRAYEPAALERLGAAVVATATLQPLLSGYAGWDGAEPEPAPEPPDDSGFNPDSGRWNPDRTVVKGQVTGGGGGGGDGG